MEQTGGDGIPTCPEHTLSLHAKPWNALVPWRHSRIVHDAKVTPRRGTRNCARDYVMIEKFAGFRREYRKRTSDLSQKC